jgi:hypothetical protein
MEFRWSSMNVCPGHSMGMSGQFHDLDALRPRKEAMCRLNRRLNGEEENLYPCKKSTPDSLVVQHAP